MIFAQVVLGLIVVVLMWDYPFIAGVCGLLVFLLGREILLVALSITWMLIALLLSISGHKKSL